MKFLLSTILFLSILSTAHAENILLNSDFVAGTQNWQLETHDLAQGALKVSKEGPDGIPALRISLEQPGAEHWHMSLLQEGLTLEAGKTYTLRFFARASEYRVFGVSLNQGSDQYQVLQGKWDVATDKDWKAIEISFTLDKGAKPGRLVFGNLGKNPGWLEIADVELLLK